MFPVCKGEWSANQERGLRLDWKSPVWIVDDTQYELYLFLLFLFGLNLILVLMVLSIFHFWFHFCAILSGISYTDIIFLHEFFLQFPHHLYNVLLFFFCAICYPLPEQIPFKTYLRILHPLIFIFRFCIFFYSC